MTSNVSAQPPRPTLRERLQRGGTVIGTASDGLGTWFLSLVLTVLVPCLPVIIDMFRASGLNGVSPGSYLVTAAVLAATYGCSAEHNFFRGLYTLMFLVSLLADAFTPPHAGVAADVQVSLPVLAQYAWTILATIALLHAAERFWWHVVWDRPFPDFLRRSD